MEENKQVSTMEKLKTSMKSLYNNSKVLLFIVGGLLVIAKVISMVFKFLSNDSKQMVVDAEAKSQQLKSEQDAANTQADALVQEAADLEKNKTEVDEDWHKR